MTKVLRCDCGAGDAYVRQNVTLPASWYLQVDLAVPTSTLAALQAATDYGTANLIDISLSGDEALALGNFSTSASLNSPTTASVNNEPAGPVFHPSVFPADQLNTVAIYYDGTDIHWSINGVALTSYAETIPPGVTLFAFGGAAFSNGVSGELYYVTNVKIGTTLGGTDIFADAFASGDTSAWSPGAVGAVSVIDDPFGGGGGGPIPGLTIKIYDLGTTVLADISAIALTRSFTRLLNAPSSFTITAPANSPLLTSIADDGFSNLYDGGNRKLVVWEDSDPETDDPIFHGRVFTVERSGDANAAQVRITAYDPRMELGYEADNRAGRVVRDSTTTLHGDPSFLTPIFSPTPSQDGISGPDLIKQILTYSQGDPSTNPVQGEGPLPIALTGTFDLDVPPAIDMNPVDSADWPVLVGDFINQLIATNAVDFDLRPVRPGTGLNLDGDPDDYIMCEASAVSKMGTDRSATVHFDYLTGSHNAKAARQECDFSLHCDRLWYELGPRLDKQHWRGDITPHSAIPVSEGLLTLMDDSADKYGGPDTLKGYNASIRVFDSLGTENSSRPLYQALYEAEVRWRVEPRRLLYITPNPDAKALFQPPQDYDVYDLVQIKTGPGFGVELDEVQRIHGYTKTWTREGVAQVSEFLTSADVA